MAVSTIAKIATIDQISLALSRVRQVTIQNPFGKDICGKPFGDFLRRSPRHTIVLHIEDGIIPIEACVCGAHDPVQPFTSYTQGFGFLMKSCSTDP